MFSGLSVLYRFSHAGYFGLGPERYAITFLWLKYRPLTSSYADITG